MKVRFYCDVPSQGVRLGTAQSWNFYAFSVVPSQVATGFTRVAFDVDMPPNLVLPPQDAVAPADPARAVEEGGAA